MALSSHSKYAKYLSVINTLREQFQAIGTSVEDVSECITTVTNMSKKLEHLNKELEEATGWRQKGKRKTLEEDTEKLTIDLGYVRSRYNPVTPPPMTMISTATISVLAIPLACCVIMPIKSNF